MATGRSKHGRSVQSAWNKLKGAATRALFFIIIFVLGGTVTVEEVRGNINA